MRVILILSSLFAVECVNYPDLLCYDFCEGNCISDKGEFKEEIMCKMHEAQICNSMKVIRKDGTYTFGTCGKCSKELKSKTGCVTYASPTGQDEKIEECCCSTDLCNANAPTLGPNQTTELFLDWEDITEPPKTTTESTAAPTTTTLEISTTFSTIISTTNETANNIESEVPNVIAEPAEPVENSGVTLSMEPIVIYLIILISEHFAF